MAGKEDQLRKQFEGRPAAGADLFTFVTAKFGGEGSRPLTTYLRALGLNRAPGDRDAGERTQDRLE